MSSSTFFRTSGARVISVTMAKSRAPAPYSSAKRCSLTPPITENGRGETAGAILRMASTPSGFMGSALVAVS